MFHQKIKTCALVALLCALVVTGCLTAKTNPAAAAKPPAAGLSPGPNDERIAYWTARLMEDYHYSQRPLDTELSERIFDGYLDFFDSRHENFLQTDIAGFAHYRTNLDTLMIGGRGNADLQPAYEIFQRFLERLQQHVAYVDELLKQDKFKFTDDDRIMIDRRHAPYPKDLDEAKELWREQLRYQYLDEKLSRELTATGSDVRPSLTKSNLTEIVDTLTRRYRGNLHLYTNWDGTDVLQAYLDALTHAYDPHSDYFNNAHAQDFSIQMSLSLFGIGATLTEDDGYCTITSLIHGGPADKSKQFNEKDRIVAVAQSNSPPVDVVNMELDKVVQLIRGPKGTEVRLTISPADDRAARRVVSVVRDEIKLEDSEAKARLIEMPDGHGNTTRLGVIDVPSFYAPIDSPGNAGHSKQSYVSADVATLVARLKQEKVSGIIIDLRTNPGGSLEEAIKFTGLFIKDGPVVQARDFENHVTVDDDTDSNQLYDGPLVVLINRYSASAAEIAAAALQDYGRALVVGDTSTHGKGTVQRLFELHPFVRPATKTATNDPGIVKITVSKFYRISGASTQLKGVVPDIVLPDWLSHSTEVGETSLENPLPWDTIAPATYDKLNLVEPYLAALRQNSDARIATNQDFIYIRQDIDELEKLQADKTATLNEREALQEREKKQSADKARDVELAARKPLDEKIYDITVENADQPRLTENAEPLEPNAATNIDAADAAANTNKITVAGSTNIMSAMAGKKSPPAIDPTLEETEQILEDYISLLLKNNTLIANH